MGVPMPEHDGGRSGEERPRVSLAGDETSVEPTSDVPRCTRCNRPLHRPQSIELGMGWRCERAA